MPARDLAVPQVSQAPALAPAQAPARASEGAHREAAALRLPASP